MKAKIMLIQPNIFVYGGAERQIVEEANWLTDHNYQVTIMTTEAVQQFKESLKEAKVFEAGSFENLVNYCRAYCNKFQIYHPHNHPAELFLHPKNAMPNVWQHNEANEVVLRGGKLDSNEVDAVKSNVTKAVVISDYEKLRFKSVYGFEPIVNYPGVDYNYFSDTSTPIHDKFGLKDNFVVLECGYITWTKNQLKTVEVFNEIKKSIPKAKLVLAGYDKDPYSESVKKKINELKLDNDVLITGYLDGDKDIRDLMRIASLHLLPT